MTGIMIGHTESIECINLATLEDLLHIAAYQGSDALMDTVRRLRCTDSDVVRVSSETHAFGSHTTYYVDLH